jgi:hypothetical protein
LKLEDFTRTHYDLTSITNGGGTYIVLHRIGSDSSLIISNEFLEHFYDMGKRRYLVGMAKQIYNETKENRDKIKEYQWKKI